MHNYQAQQVIDAQSEIELEGLLRDLLDGRASEPPVGVDTLPELVELRDTARMLRATTQWLPLPEGRLAVRRALLATAEQVEGMGSPTSGAWRRAARWLRTAGVAVAVAIAFVLGGGVLDRVVLPSSPLYGVRQTIDKARAMLSPIRTAPPGYTLSYQLADVQIPTTGGTTTAAGRVGGLPASLALTAAQPGACPSGQPCGTFVMSVAPLVGTQASAQFGQIDGTFVCSGDTCELKLNQGSGVFSKVAQSGLSMQSTAKATGVIQTRLVSFADWVSTVANAAQALQDRGLLPATVSVGTFVSQAADQSTTTTAPQQTAPQGTPEKAPGGLMRPDGGTAQGVGAETPGQGIQSGSGDAADGGGQPGRLPGWGQAGRLRPEQPVGSKQPFLWPGARAPRQSSAGPTAAPASSRIVPAASVSGARRTGTLTTGSVITGADSTIGAGRMVPASAPTEAPGVGSPAPVTFPVATPELGVGIPASSTADNAAGPAGGGGAGQGGGAGGEQGQEQKGTGSQGTAGPGTGSAGSSSTGSPSSGAGHSSSGSSGAQQGSGGPSGSSPAGGGPRGGSGSSSGGGTLGGGHKGGSNSDGGGVQGSGSSSPDGGKGGKGGNSSGAGGSSGGKGGNSGGSGSSGGSSGGKGGNSGGASGNRGGSSNSAGQGDHGNSGGGTGSGGGGKGGSNSGGGSSSGGKGGSSGGGAGGSNGGKGGHNDNGSTSDGRGVGGANSSEGAGSH